MLAELHPYLVHFPIALLTVGFLFDVASLFSSRLPFRQMGATLLVIGVVVAGAAVLTGDQAMDAAEHAGVHKHIIEPHEESATVTLFLFLGLLIARILLRKRESAWLWRGYLVVALLAVFMLLRTGYLGGKLVFEHGIAVKRAAPTAPATPQR